MPAPAPAPKSLPDMTADLRPVANSAPSKLPDMTADLKPAAGTDLPGSVFDRPTVGQRLKRIGSAIAPAVVGTAFPVGTGIAVGALLGPEASEPVAGATRVAAQALAGAIAPYAEYGTEKLLGEQPQAPTISTMRDLMHDSIKSAVWNGALAGIGEAGAAAAKWGQTEDAVRAELAKLPKSQQTVSKIKQIRQGLAQLARNRNFWQGLGLSDPQIDEVIKTPELQQSLARSIEQANKTKQAYSAVLDYARSDFHSRYDQLLGNAAKAPVPTPLLGQSIKKVLGQLNERELTPSFGAFLARKVEELAGPKDIGELSDRDAIILAYGPEYAQLSEKANAADMGNQARILLQASMQKGFGGPIGGKLARRAHTISDLRDIRTELRENLPSNPTNLDKGVYQTVKSQIDAMEEQELHKAGATPDQIAGLKALDQEYGRFADTVRATDPRSAKYGQQVANLLYDPMAKNPGIAMNLISIAQKADRVNPGVMNDLRDSFVSKALAEARQPGQPFEELKYLRKLQNQWGGDPEARSVMGAMFGKDSPLADPAAFTKVVEAGSDPVQFAHEFAQHPSARHSLSSPYIQAMVLYGVGASAMLAGGAKGGLWGAMTGQKGSGAQILAIGSLLAGPPLIGWVIRSGNSPLQRAMVGFLTNPNASTAIRYAGKLSGAMTGALLTTPGQTPPPAAPAGTPAPPAAPVSPRLADLH